MTIPVVGTSLKENYPERYVVRYDVITGAWFIYDMWDDDIKDKPLDFDIPDDHSSVTVIKEEAFKQLLLKAREIDFKGVVQTKDDIEYGNELLESDNQLLKEEIESLKNELNELNTLNNQLMQKSILSKETDKRSEAFELKLKALDVIRNVSIVKKLNSEVLDVIIRLAGNGDLK